MSSQAMMSADFSTSMALGVMSSKLPIGVATIDKMPEWLVVFKDMMSSMMNVLRYYFGAIILVHEISVAIVYHVYAMMNE